jgi:membrane-bound ClpP family serine protease
MGNRERNEWDNHPIGECVGYIIGAIVITTLLALGVVLTRALQGSPVPSEPPTDALVGSLGTVVIRIPDSGVGEVTITQPGQQLRVAAQAEASIDEGATVVVVDVPSPEAVTVAESGF